MLLHTLCPWILAKTLQRHAAVRKPLRHIIDVALNLSRVNRTVCYISRAIVKKRNRIIHTTSSSLPTMAVQESANQHSFECYLEEIPSVLPSVLPSHRPTSCNPSPFDVVSRQKPERCRENGGIGGPQNAFDVSPT